MTLAATSFIVYVIFAVLVCSLAKKDRLNLSGKTFVFLSAAALLMRILISAVFDGYETDMNCFKAWSGYAASVLPWDFYDSVWCDYPPGYLYILSLVGFLKNIFGDISPMFYRVLIKLPACLCDVFTAWFIFKIPNKKRVYPGCASVLYLFCPALIANSAVWGQVDSVFTLFICLFAFALCERKYYRAALYFAAAVLLKVQALMFAPLCIYVLIKRTGEEKGIIKKFCVCVCIFAAVAALGVLPYAAKQPPGFLFKLYFATAGQYPYASLNAFNFFSMIGKNLAPSSGLYLGISYRCLGFVNIGISVFLCGILYIKNCKKGSEFYCAALLIMLIFTFASDMHERYLFSAIALFAASYAQSGDGRSLAAAGLAAFSQFVNVSYLYYLNTLGTVHIPPSDAVLRIFSAFTVAAALAALIFFIPRKETDK